MTTRASVLLVARRELALARRSRAAWGAFVLLSAVAWLPPLLLPLRRGAIGLAGFDEALLLAMALGAVILPIVALVMGADLFAGELEDGTLVPVITLPISRDACFAGKYLGRMAIFTLAYLVAFSGVGVTVAAVRGTEGAGAFLGVAAAGLLLCLTCAGVGVALGVTGHGRVRALGSALGTWLVLVFAIDAALLGAIVALAPPPPTAVGTHGHAELRVAEQQSHIHDPQAEPTANDRGALSRSLPWLMTLDPVDLFRLLALQANPQLRARLSTAIPASGGTSLWLPIAVGWVLWLHLPPLIGLRRFRRASLR